MHKRIFLRLILVTYFCLTGLIFFPKIALSAPVCSSINIDLYTTDKNGQLIGPTLGQPFNIIANTQAGSKIIEQGRTYKIDAYSRGTNLIKSTQLVSSPQDNTITFENFQIDRVGNYNIYFTLTQIVDSKSVEICSTDYVTALQAKNPQPPPGINCSDPNNKDKCTGGKGLVCNLSDGIPFTPANPKDIDPSKTGIYTAIGCIPTQPQLLIEGILKYGTFAAGGIAFIMMILAALQMITAEGNPEAIKGGQEKFYSAIIGLLLIIFSVLLMQVIGVDILGLPGFGTK